ncbi:MAG TPA: hypothetical protein VFV71_01095 [Burkholderiales bacterium]|nr:hypothetical protein [Burkholderiales bacterium]
MPWTEERCPPAMAHLAPLVRGRAVEIANALLREGHGDGFAIRVGIARARQWADMHGLSGAGDDAAARS